MCGARVERLFVGGYFLAEKRLDANACIGVMQIFHKLIAFLRQVICHVVCPRIIDEFFDAVRHIGGELVDALRHCQCLRQRMTAIDDAVDNTQLVQALCTDRVTQEQQLCRQLMGKRMGQNPAATRIG